MLIDVVELKNCVEQRERQESEVGCLLAYWAPQLLNETGKSAMCFGNALSAHDKALRAQSLPLQIRNAQKCGNDNSGLAADAHSQRHDRHIDSTLTS
jgi:hypothetical protein